MTGLLTQLPNKNCETLAAIVPHTSEQQLQGLLTRMVWDSESLNQQLSALCGTMDETKSADHEVSWKSPKTMVREYSRTIVFEKLLGIGLTFMKS